MGLPSLLHIESWLFQESTNIAGERVVNRSETQLNDASVASYTGGDTLAISLLDGALLKR